jgi:hypothetical protein
MSERDRAIILGMLQRQAADLERMQNVVCYPPGHRFTANYGLPPRAGCKGTTRDGRPCAAHPQIVGPDGYCHWHSPSLAWERRAWCDARRGPRWIRWGIALARASGDRGLARQGERLLLAQARGNAIAGRWDSHPVSALPLPALDALPMGQRRVVEALLAGETGRTYAEAAAVLGLHVGCVHAHLARIGTRHPATYDAIMSRRAEQLELRHEAAQEREYRRTAARRAVYVEAHGREPWAT